MDDLIEQPFTKEKFIQKQKKLIEVAEIVDSNEKAKDIKPTSKITYHQVSKIKAKPICWLWKGRIARGKPTVVAGNPGLGKSQVTINMAATVSTGGTWPVDHAKCEQGNVIFLSAEDDPEDTIRPRLEAAGADLDKIYIVDAIEIPGESDNVKTFNLKTDLERLSEMIEEIGGAHLIVIDPITAYLGNVDSHKNSDVRALLTPLSALAAKHNVAVVCVSHLNKGGSGDALMRVSGSLAFVAAARAAYIVHKDKENGTRRLFLPIKNNNGNDQTGLAFSVEEHSLTDGYEIPIETSRIIWEKDAVTITADEAISSPYDDEKKSARECAKDTLKELLKNGNQIPVSEIKEWADGEGYSWETIRRAKKDLSIESVKMGMENGWAWKLPNKIQSINTEIHTKEVKNPEGGQSNGVTSFEEFDPLRDR